MKNNNHQEKNIMNDKQYEILNTRRDNYNNLIWNTPMLSLTALSFLFTIMFSNKIDSHELLLLSILSFTVSIFSMQLLMKYRFYEEDIAKILQKYEEQKKDEDGFGVISKKIKCKRKKKRKIFSKLRFFIIKLSSYKLFLFLLGLFALSSCYKIYSALKILICNYCKQL
jgi:hypothetical protein